MDDMPWIKSLENDFKSNDATHMSLYMWWIAVPFIRADKIFDFQKCVRWNGTWFE